MTKAEIAGRSVIISCDANSKMGPKYIQGDPNPMSENGRILEGIINRHARIVANGITEIKDRINHKTKIHQRI